MRFYCRLSALCCRLFSFLSTVKIVRDIALQNRPGFFDAPCSLGHFKVGIVERLDVEQPVGRATRKNGANLDDGDVILGTLLSEANLGNFSEMSRSRGYSSRL